MIVTRQLMIFVCSVISLGISLGYADERIWLKDAKINGMPVKLGFDSGANGNALFPLAVKRLGLKFNAAPTNDLSSGLLAGDTELCNVEIEGSQWRTTFLVLDTPGYVGADFDGLIGWYSLSQNVLQIDAAAGAITYLAKVPRKVTKWIQFSVITNSGLLELDVPHTNRPNGVIFIDTGMDSGMQLPSREWHQWKEEHPHSPTTMTTFYSPAEGFVVREEAWADQVHIGSLVLTGVPIMEETPFAAKRWGDNYDGTLGLAALNRLNLIIDGKNSVAYLQPKTTRPPACSHNRLGAIFVPTATHTNEGVAIVITGSPAYDAGVRNGDILLQVDDIPVIAWTDDWISRFYLPAGTKLHLTLQRDGKNFKTIATLRQILPPDR